MIDINLDVLAEFKSITNVDAQAYLATAADFLSTSYNRIVSYYGGHSSQASQSDFTAFKDLQDQTESMLATYRLQGRALSNLKYWLLLEHIEDIDSRLSSLAKINKWSKSSLTDFGYDPAMQAVYTTKPKQTLERVAQDILNTSTPEDDWYDIAVKNQLREEDYSPAGGTALNLSFPRVNQGINISAVVAVMIGKAIYGLDFDQKIQFVNDDLKVLSFDDTVQQDMYILANLRKNDNPDFPNQGLQSTVAVGGTRASLNFPIITRQITETFATDDSFKNFTLLNLQVIDDRLEITFQVQTRLDETVDGRIAV